jgi:ligand-binding sensor domain-containing protein
VYGAAEAVRGGNTALLKTYRVGLDLPAAPLGAMAVGRLRGASEPELLIATAGEGILAFSASGAADGGGSFRQIRPADPEARDVTALLPLATGELLVGTRKRGLLVYRGTTGNMLETWHPQLAALAVTALAADATGFWVGTRDHGVRHCHAGQIDSFDAGTDGAGGALPDEQVDAIAVQGDRVFVGTPLGVQEFDDGRPSRTLARNLFANALYADEKSVTVGSLDEGIRRVSLEVNRRPDLAFAGSDESNGGGTQQFLRADADDSLFAVMRDGLRERDAGGSWVPLVKDADAAVLTDGNVSALAFGPDGRLWVGYFDRGLDVVSTSGPTEHREDDRLFCINRMVLDPRRKTMVVATANGLVLFDAEGKPRQTMTRRDGLIADHVTDIAFAGDSMVLATPAGLTFVDADGARSLYAFEGLVNNHVYALGVQDKTLLAGTLGGVSELEQESVRRNLTVSNSGLKHNWVTAIVPDGDGSWMIGTYGAGVMRLDNAGRVSPMDGATRTMDVNPNAMLRTDAHILAGTLGQGLWVWSRAAERWRQITAGLPSKNVTAIAARDGEVYVGTDNGLVRIAERLLD